MIHPDTTAYHGQLAPAERAQCEQLAAVISEVLPEAENRIWHAHPVWFLDGNPVTGYSKLKGGIRLLFWSGQSFSTPDLRPEGKFKAAEWRFTEAQALDLSVLRAWLAESRAIQWDYQNLVRRKGRLDRLK